MKGNIFFVLFLLSLLLVPGFVSAQYYGGGFWYGTEQVIDSLVMNLEPILRALLGGNDWTGYLLFEKTLLFMLISIIVGVILGNLPFFQGFQHKGILRLVALIIGLLGVRNLNYIWVSTIITQYQVLFIAITGILPFMIYWYFVNGLNGLVKKVAWVFYAVIYFGLWATSDLEAYEGVYLWSALISLAYGLFLDTMVTQWLKTQEMKKQFSRHTWNQIAELNERIGKLHKQIAENYHPDPQEARRQIHELEDHRNKLARGRRSF
ncbi:MAG: hypothetical protein AABX10_02115 [Nanoarchaeota archaeon]